MWKRRLVIVAIVACASLLVASVVSVWLCDRPSATRRNFDRIQVGMTEAEVKKILGAPSGYYLLPPGAWGSLARVVDPEESRGRVTAMLWTTKEAEIWVNFRPDGTEVDSKLFYPSPPLLDRVKAWLGW